MSAEQRCPTGDLVGVTAHLLAEFEGRLPPGLVQAEVAVARQELLGQTSPAALAELLHRLARHRLQEHSEQRRAGRSSASLGPEGPGEQEPTEPLILR